MIWSFKNLFQKWSKNKDFLHTKFSNNILFAGDLEQSLSYTYLNSIDAWNILFNLSSQHSFSSLLNLILCKSQSCVSKEEYRLLSFDILIQVDQLLLGCEWFTSYIAIITKPVTIDNKSCTKKEMYIIDLSSNWDLIGYWEVDIFDEAIFWFTRNFELYQWRNYNYNRYLTAKNIINWLFPDIPFYLSKCIADERSLKAANKLVSEWKMIIEKDKKGDDRYRFI